MNISTSPELRSAVRELSHISAVRAIVAISTQWAVIGASAFAALYFHHWIIYIIAALVIATRQHALGVLMHDAAHHRLFPNHLAGEWISNILLAFPVGLSTRLYRDHHLLHHNHVNTNSDPDWCQLQADEANWGFPMLWRNGLLVFIRDLLGINAPGWIKTLAQWSPIQSPRSRWVDRITFVLWWTAVIAGLTFTHGGTVFLGLWVLPLLTLTSVIFRIRGLAEHVGVENEHELNATRVVLPTLLERLLICPCNVNYHLEHHLFPSIPFYNLPRLHRMLMADASFASQAHITQGYLNFRTGVLSELLLAHNSKVRKG